MDDQQGFVVGVSSGGRPIEAPRDHCFVVDHGELVMDLVAAAEAGGGDALYLQCFLKKPLRDVQVSHGSISQKPSQEGSGSRVEMPDGYEELLDP